MTYLKDKTIYELCAMYPLAKYNGSSSLKEIVETIAAKVFEIPPEDRKTVFRSMDPDTKDLAVWQIMEANGYDYEHGTVTKPKL